MGTGNIVIAPKYNTLETFRLLRKNYLIINRAETLYNDLVSSIQLKNSSRN